MFPIEDKKIENVERIPIKHNVRPRGKAYRRIVNINRIPPGSVSFGVDTAPIKMPVYHIIRNNKKVTPPEIECHELRCKT